MLSPQPYPCTWAPLFWGGGVKTCLADPVPIPREILFLQYGPLTIGGVTGSISGYPRSVTLWRPCRLHASMGWLKNRNFCVTSDSPRRPLGPLQQCDQRPFGGGQNNFDQNQHLYPNGANPSSQVYDSLCVRGVHAHLCWVTLLCMLPAAPPSLIQYICTASAPHFQHPPQIPFFCQFAYLESPDVQQYFCAVLFIPLKPIPIQ